MMAVSIVMNMKDGDPTKLKIETVFYLFKCPNPQHRPSLHEIKAEKKGSNSINADEGDNNEGGQGKESITGQKEFNERGRGNSERR